MAASATSLFSPLCLRPPRFSLLPPHPHPLYSLSSPLLKPLHPLSLLPTKYYSPLRASPSDQFDPDPDLDTDTDTDTDTATTILLTDSNELFDYDSKYDDPPSPSPEGMYNPPAFYDAPPESEEDIGRAYEELYGPAYSSESFLGNDIYGGEGESGWEDDDLSDGDESFGPKIDDEFEERVVQVRRVTKVVKGGRLLNFRVVVIVGDFQGHVGVGVGKAPEVVPAVKRATINARRNVIRIPLTKYSTFPHRADGKAGAAKVMLRPACPGSGVNAGGAVRIVLELAGVQNALGKQLGSNNILNNARATIVAVQKMRQFSEVAAQRGLPMEELWK